MADVNQLLQSVDSVPTVPTGGVQVVNPLAAITAGNQAAQSEFQTRGLQAQQAIGQILQQSTDANGNVDYQKAHQMAAAAGPIVQMGMAKFAGEASQLRGQQIKQAVDLHGFIADLAASGVNDPSPENIARMRAEGKSYGLADAGLAEMDRIGAIADPEQRRMEFYKHLQSRLDTVRQLATTPYGIPDVRDTGGQIQQFQNQAPIPGRPGAFRPGGSAPITPTPGEVIGQGGYHYQATQEDIDAGRATRLGQDIFIPGAEIYRRAGLPIPPGLQSPGASGGGGGAPSVTPPPPPAGNAPPRAARPPPGTRGSSLETAGGVQVASADSQMVPATGAPGAPSPAVAGDVADIQAGVAGARGSPRPPGTRTAWNTIATGPGLAEAQGWKADTDAYIQDKATIPDVTTRTQNLAHAWDALSLLKKLNSETGKGADTVNAVRSRLGTLGLLPEGSVKIQELQDLFAKYTEKAMLDAAGSSTNLGKEMAQKSSPGSLLSMGANFAVMRDNLATDLQKIAATKDHETNGGNGPSYLSDRNKVVQGIDKRGLVWNMYDPDEQAKIRDEANKAGPTAVSRLKRAIGMSHILELTPPGAPLAPPPGKGSFLTPPPAPQVNALSMAG